MLDISALENTANLGSLLSDMLSTVGSSVLPQKNICLCCVFSNAPQDVELIAQHAVYTLSNMVHKTICLAGCAAVALDSPHAEETVAQLISSASLTR